MIMVERYWPGVSAGDVEAAIARLARAATPDGGVHHLNAILVPAEDVVFCLFEASSHEAVIDLNRRADVRFDRVHTVEPITRSGTGRRDATAYELDVPANVTSGHRPPGPKKT